jgi:chemotaxis protein methyltransferase CheR
MLPEEIDLSDRDFARICHLLKARAGIDLGPGKRTLVYGRLARRVRLLDLHSFDAYLQIVEDPDSPESGPFLNALTTNVTEFFREGHHFELLARRVLPEVQQRQAARKRVRLWSAGCSTGEEPYSLAMVVAESFPLDQGWDVKILATDIDSDVLAEAARGIYTADRAAKIGGERLGRHFLRGSGAHGGQVRIRDEVRRLVTFKHLNLIGPWPMNGPFDAIFCRNVLIYFDGQTRRQLAGRFVEVLGDPGFLFLGHSESLVAGNLTVESFGPTAYRKVRARTGVEDGPR